MGHYIRIYMVRRLIIKEIISIRAKKAIVKPKKVIIIIYIYSNGELKESGKREKKEKKEGVFNRG